jgi:pimeloyl-ACP methyl ester carboxylesterase
VLFGESDDAWSPQVQRDMADRLGCPVVVVPGSVHSPAVENPEVTVDALLRFWHA